MIPSLAWFACWPVGLAALVGEERHDALGLTFEVPARYEPFPVRPDEEWIVLKYVAETSARKGSEMRAVLHVIQIPAGEDPEPLPDPPPIHDLERYVAQELDGWKVAATSAGAAKPGWVCKELELKPADGKQTTLAAWAYAHEGEGVTWVLFGLCFAEEFEKEVKAWRRSAERMEFFAPVVSKETLKWTRFYEKNPRFRNPAARLRVRARLVDGWEAEDTENFLFVYSTKKESLVQHLQKRLEGIRRAYVERFPPAREITAVSTVRICENQEEYQRYGGSPNTAGFWNSSTEELVLFVFEYTGSYAAKEGKEDSRLVMFHEGFHQYIHYAAGELAPHSWFNEGYGDYFGGAQFNIHGAVSKIEVNPWRIARIQGSLWQRAHASWADITKMSQETFYGANRSTNYAMAWSMIYFLNHSKEVRKEPTWKQILPTYFETLKAAHAREQAALASAGKSEDREAVEKAHETARAEALRIAFRDVDLNAIEEAWRAFTLELEAPK